jgi:hypothetical protein
MLSQPGLLSIRESVASSATLRGAAADRWRDRCIAAGAFVSSTALF